MNKMRLAKKKLFNKKQALLKEQMNSRQYEYIYRLYEGLLCKALVSGIKHDKLLILAKESLQKSRKTLPILVRKIVSIELFVKIKIMLF